MTIASAYERTSGSRTRANSSAVIGTSSTTPPPLSESPVDTADQPGHECHDHVVGIESRLDGRAEQIEQQPVHGVVQQSDLERATR